MRSKIERSFWRISGSDRLSTFSTESIQSGDPCVTPDYAFCADQIGRTARPMDVRMRRGLPYSRPSHKGCETAIALTRSAGGSPRWPNRDTLDGDWAVIERALGYGVSLTTGATTTGRCFHLVPGLSGVGTTRMLPLSLRNFIAARESGCGPELRFSNVCFCAAVGEKRTLSARIGQAAL